MRLKDIEKLRAAALLMVLLGHLPVAIPPFLIHGYTGVVLFFMISGYVSCLSFEKSQERYASSAHPRLYTSLEFYIARFFRVVPLIGIWLLLYFLGGQLTNHLGGSYGDSARFFTELGWWCSGLYNYYFAYSGMSGLFGHLWSMAIELQFYLFTAQLDAGWYLNGKRITAWSLKMASLSFSAYISNILLFSCVYYNLYVMVLLPKFPWLATGGGIALQAVVLLCCALGIGWLSSELIEKPYATYSKKVISNLRVKFLNNVGGAGT